MFEEWLEDVLDIVADGDAADIQMLIREAYKLGLQRGYDCSTDTKKYGEVSMELEELNKEDEADAS